MTSHLTAKSPYDLRSEILERPLGQRLQEVALLIPHLRSDRELTRRVVAVMILVEICGRRDSLFDGREITWRQVAARAGIAKGDDPEAGNAAQKFVKERVTYRDFVKLYRDSGGHALKLKFREECQSHLAWMNENTPKGWRYFLSDAARIFEDEFAMKVRDAVDSLVFPSEIAATEFRYFGKPLQECLSTRLRIPIAAGLLGARCWEGMWI